MLRSILETNVQSVERQVTEAAEGLEGGHPDTLTHTHPTCSWLESTRDGWCGVGSLAH